MVLLQPDQLYSQAEPQVHQTNAKAMGMLNAKFYKEECSMHSKSKQASENDGGAHAT